VEAFERDDGLWDIEACVTDHKSRDVALASGIRPAGLPIHELWLRLTVDREMNIVDAESSSAWVPYPGHCEKINPAYRALIGLNLRRQFRRQVIERVGGLSGCTHLTELCAVLPTAAIQAFAGEVRRQEPDAARASVADSDVTASTPPFQLDRCHALRFDGAVVQQFYPRWYGHAPRAAASTFAGAESVGTGAPQVARCGDEVHP